MLIVDPSRFLVSPANQLAYQAVEAFLRGDADFARVLLVGPRGSGKTSLANWVASMDRAAPVFDPLQPARLDDLARSARIFATYSSAEDDVTEVIERFRAVGGRTCSLVIEAELTEAVARNMANDLGIQIDDETVRLIVERMASPVLVRGALHRLRAEAALHGRQTIDNLFALRVLGGFLYPTP